MLGGQLGTHASGGVSPLVPEHALEAPAAVVGVEQGTTSLVEGERTWGACELPPLRVRFGVSGTMRSGIKGEDAHLSPLTRHNHPWRFYTPFLSALAATQGCPLSLGATERT